MNFLVRINTVYLSFIPNAGNSISIAMVAVILFFVLSGVSLGLYCKNKVNKDSTHMLFQRTEEKQYLESGNGNLPFAV